MPNEIKPEQVPASAADAAKELGVSRWVARDIVAAVINAWPGMTMLGPHSSGHGRSEPALILPLPTEASDE